MDYQPSWSGGGSGGERIAGASGAAGVGAVVIKGVFIDNRGFGDSAAGRRGRLRGSAVLSARRQHLRGEPVHSRGARRCGASLGVERDAP